MLLLKRWYKFNTIMQKYKKEEYYLLYCGVCKVKTQDIKGLSLWPPSKLLNDDKMARLEGLVKQNGWNDRYPQDLNLYYTPRGIYTVSHGGNHRPLLADKLHIKEIYACVDLVIPYPLVSQEAHNNIRMLNELMYSIDKQAKSLDTYLNSKGAYRLDYTADEKKLDELYSESDKVYEEIKKVYRIEAKKNIYFKEFLEINSSE